MFQSYALFPNLTVAQNIAFGLENQGLARDLIKERVDHWLGLVDLTVQSHKYLSQISGGQQQRVALAGRSPSPPACCCWTNRSARWMHWYAPTFAARSAPCSSALASPPSW